MNHQHSIEVSLQEIIIIARESLRRMMIAFKLRFKAIFIAFRHQQSETINNNWEASFCLMFFIRSFFYYILQSNCDGACLMNGLDNSMSSSQKSVTSFFCIGLLKTRSCQKSLPGMVIKWTTLAIDWVTSSTFINTKKWPYRKKIFRMWNQAKKNGNKHV